MRQVFFGGSRRGLCVFFLLFAGISCERETHQKASSHDARPRVTEARLTGFDAWRRCGFRDDSKASVPAADCGATNIPSRVVSIAIGECEVMMKSEAEAIEVLAYAPQCTDAAVEKLEYFAARQHDEQTLSDLAAGYQIRAQRKGHPSDVVRALSAAEAALALNPNSPHATFNAALAGETLGLLDRALARWDALSRSTEAGWNTEAAEHATRVREQQRAAAELQWKKALENLAGPIESGNSNKIDQIIAPLRSAAQVYVEEVLLNQWATAKDEEAAEKSLKAAEEIAASCERLNHDRYLRDAVAMLRSSERKDALRKGLLAFFTGRAKQREFGGKPEPYYAAAERLLARAGSPLQYGAALGRVTSLTQAENYAKASALLDDLTEAAIRHHYPYLLARIHSARGYLFTVKGAYLDALAEYADAQAIYDRTMDADNLGKIHARQVGLLLEVRDFETAWRFAFRARRFPPSDLTSRHLAIGETARAAVAIGQPAIGLHFQDALIAQIRSLPNHDAPEVQKNLGVALRARAGILAVMGKTSEAKIDLDEAIPRIGTPANDKDAAIPIGFRARLAEVRAQTLAPNDRHGAIREYTEAIGDASKTHYRTLLASLLAQRAGLFVLENDRRSATNDLLRAVNFLREEARSAVRGEKRERTPPDPLWSSYFTRPQEAYRDLVRLLVESGDDAQAFAFAEESRAYAPLHLLLQRGEVPAEFRRKLGKRPSFDLAITKRAIPDDTYLLEYCVLDDRTYIWIVQNGEAERQTLPVGNRQIAQWTEALQKAADRRNEAEFISGLRAPYDALLKEPIARIDKLHGDRNGPARIVIIPDRAMHGLPFAALSNGNDYLFENHVLSIDASASLYVYSLDRDEVLSRKPADAVLLVGDPAFETSLGITNGLEQGKPGLRIERIAGLYDPLIDVIPLTRDKATPDQVLRLAPRGTVIHLAAHGLVNPDAASQSLLLLAPAENDSGTLNAARMTRELHLRNTRLVVLAACSSAGGTPVGPAGLAPLVRPLVAAGVPGVIGTLWNVSSNAETEELLVRFHHHYGNGVAADDALRNAQRELLADPDASRHSPLAWAPFQLTGHASSPFKQAKGEQ